MSSIDPIRVISAAGFVTTLGGGALPESVRDAIADAAAATWRVDELQAWAGEEIARATGAESGWVTAGAAAGMTLAAAACIAGKRKEAMAALPEADGSPAEVVVQAPHRNAYDRALRTAGASIVTAGYPMIEGAGLTYEWQIEAAIGERTAAVAHWALADERGVPLRRVCELAAKHGIPVIVDAAAELPPSGNLRRFVAEGASLVAFSGGKAMRGPQASGILAGRRDLIESVRLQTLDMDVDVAAWVERWGSEPPHHGLGRSMKVGKEEIVGLVAALRDFVKLDHDAEAAEMRLWLEESLLPLAGHRPVRIDTDLSFYPRLVVQVGTDARASATRLAALERPVVVPHAPLERGELVVCPEAIDEPDRAIVEVALRDLWKRTPPLGRTEVAPPPGGRTP